MARIHGRDVIDYATHEDMELQRSDMPGIVEIVELDQNDGNGDGDCNDPDYEPSSARSRGNVLRKRKNVEKKPRSRSRGRRTRSQAAMDDKPVEVDWSLAKLWFRF